MVDGMAAKDNLNSKLFGAYNVTISPHLKSWGGPAIFLEDDKGNYVGNLVWTNRNLPTNYAATGGEDRGDGAIIDVEVSDKHQRKGIATEMWKLAEQLHKQQPWHYPKIKHSSYRTDEGNEWAWALHERGLSARPPHNRYDEMDEEF